MRKRGSGPWPSYEVSIECCRTLQSGKKSFLLLEYKILTALCCLRWPPFSRLYGEERQHGRDDVVVVEQPPLPFATLYPGRSVAPLGKDEKLAPGKREAKYVLDTMKLTFSIF